MHVKREHDEEEKKNTSGVLCPPRIRANMIMTMHNGEEGKKHPSGVCFPTGEEQSDHDDAQWRRRKEQHLWHLLPHRVEENMIMTMHNNEEGKRHTSAAPFLPRNKANMTMIMHSHEGSQIPTLTPTDTDTDTQIQSKSELVEAMHDLE